MSLKYANEVMLVIFYVLLSQCIWVFIYNVYVICLKMPTLNKVFKGTAVDVSVNFKTIP